MPLTALYYHLKPYIPSQLRLGLRRVLARRLRKSCRATWPISESAAEKPAGWCGWPKGKQFAFVIMHDVEGRAGLENCRALMDLEQSLGFRSCFNFIPQGGYTVPAELREEIVSRGGEVGVHDLYHDGKLYNTRKAFAKNAARINEYLKAWKSVGFRSAFMLNKLEWLHDLNISYDASTFDTDPFEPQPQGKNTIFPFWVPREHSSVSNLKPASVDGIGENRTSSGYVELPYTLAQDSTIFGLLQEKSSDIWFQKLRWIAKHGGMALIGVHPDYISFGNKTAGAFAYPESLYKEFLCRVRQSHGDNFWGALPREVSSFYVERHVAPAGKTRAFQNARTAESPHNLGV